MKSSAVIVRMVSCARHENVENERIGKEKTEPATAAMSAARDRLAARTGCENMRCVFLPGLSVLKLGQLHQYISCSAHVCLLGNGVFGGFQFVLTVSGEEIPHSAYRFQIGHCAFRIIEQR